MYNHNTNLKIFLDPLHNIFKNNLKFSAKYKLMTA